MTTKICWGTAFLLFIYKLINTLAEISFQYEPEKIFRDKKPKHVKQYFGTEILAEIYD